MPKPDKPICVVYDCLFPWTVGGAERWYRELADGLVQAGVGVVYLTRQQWKTSSSPDTSFTVEAVIPPMNLYDGSGRRRILPGLRFGWGVFRHLLTHRQTYHAAHVANFPFFSLLAAKLALAGTSVPVAVDWHEVWSRRYWVNYAGPVVGRLGFGVQKLCLMLSGESTYVFSERNAQLFREAGGRVQPTALAGLVPDSIVRSTRRPAAQPPLVVFAGRHILDKGVDIVPDVFARVHARHPSIRFVICGDGPQRQQVVARTEALGISDSVQTPGFVTDEDFYELLATAACLFLPSKREGYGMIVAECTALGTPVVVADYPENAAVEHVVSGDNGVVVHEPDIQSLADAISEVIAAGEPMRDSAFAMRSRLVEARTISSSVRTVVNRYLAGDEMRAARA